MPDPAHVRAIFDHAHRHMGLSDAVARAAGGEAVAFEIHHPHPDGSVQWFAFALTPVRDAAGTVWALLPEGREITALKEAQQLKDQVLGMVGHDLRGPLSSMGFAIDWLITEGEGATPARWREILLAAQQGVDRLMRLTDDLLDTERLLAGYVAADRHPVPVVDLLQEAARVFGPQAQAADVALVVDAAPGAVLADPDRVAQVLANLVGNALTFSPPGGEVRLSARPAGTQVEIAVADQGRGIPAHKLEAVFERFTQVEPGNAAHLRGLGLGLAIARRIVEAHGGRIWAESAPGAGATFRFTLDAA